jgi:hypothetical protein
MKNSTDDVDSKRFLGPTFSVWDVPETELSVHLHLSTVEWLDYEITRSLTSPEGGAEAGGLLLGRIESDSRRRIIIEGFTPVPCEHQFGSVYHLSVSDKRFMHDQLTRWHAGPGKKLYVVGYYRSHHRDELKLDDEDMLLAKEYLSNSVSVILLIQPSGARLGLGAFFFCEKGQVESEPKLVFPLNRTSLTHRPPDETNSSAEIELRPARSVLRHLRDDRSDLVSESMPERPPIQAVSLPQSTPLQARPLLLWTAMAVLVLVLGGIGYKYLLKPVVAPTASGGRDLTELELAATAENRLLRITWNKSSPAIASAKHGILSIADRASWTQLTLSTEQLQTGALMYPHESDEVTVRLRVVGSDRETTESARILRAVRQEGSPAQPQAGGEPASNKVETPPPMAANKDPIPDLAPRAEKTPIGAHMDASSRSKTPVPASRSEAAKTRAEVQEPPAVAASEKPPLVSTPPSVKTSTGAAPAPSPPPQPSLTLPRSDAAEVNEPPQQASPLASQSVPPKSPVVPAAEARLPPPSEPSPKVTDLPRPPEETAKPPGQPLAPGPSKSEPVRTETSRSVPGKDSSPETPAARNSHGSGVQGPSPDYVAPQAVRRVTPHVPTSLRNLPVTGLQVDVKVYIDAGGAVVRTEPLSKENSLMEYLSSVAADAARQWRFSPARRGNQNVPSETILHFHFGNSRE